MRLSPVIRFILTVAVLFVVCQLAIIGLIYLLDALSITPWVGLSHLAFTISIAVFTMLGGAFVAYLLAGPPYLSAKPDDATIEPDEPDDADITTNPEEDVVFSLKLDRSTRATLIAIGESPPLDEKGTKVMQADISFDEQPTPFASFSFMVGEGTSAEGAIRSCVSGAYEIALSDAEGESQELLFSRNDIVALTIPLQARDRETLVTNTRDMLLAMHSAPVITYAIPPLRQENLN